MTREQDSAKGRITAEDLKQMLAEDGDLLKTIVEQTVQQVLEAEMDEALQAGKSERSEQRMGYRSGYYSRTLITRVGKIELRVPQDRPGRFRREVFEAVSTERESAGRRPAGDVCARRIHAQGEEHHRRTVRA